VRRLVIDHHEVDDVGLGGDEDYFEDGIVPVVDWIGPEKVCNEAPLEQCDVSAVEPSSIERSRT
jgi:hypothetical protein